MKIETRDYSLDLATTRKAVLSGILRLDSPLAYDSVMQPITDALESSEGTFTLDISGVQFMNSAGITRLSRFVLFARELGRKIQVIASSDLRWQVKTAASLKRLHSDLHVVAT